MSEDAEWVSSSLYNRYWLADRERLRLKKQLKITRAALREIASEGCTYAGHGDDLPDECLTTDWDPECPGEVCTAKKSLREARAVKYA